MAADLTLDQLNAVLHGTNADILKKAKKDENLSLVKACLDNRGRITPDGKIQQPVAAM